jgi:hypothetical protein
MNKTLKYALSAVLGLALLAPTFAQQFPDVGPPEHWAYDAVLRLKNAGLLVGYPDGRFRGPRNATRYEMAVAIHATYDFLKKITDDHEARIRALEANPGGVSAADFDALKKAVSDLQNDVAMMKRWRTELDDLNRMAREFQRELSSLGVDVAAMKKDLTDLQERVGVLEKRKPAVDIHGDVNFLALGGYSQSGDFGISVDGRYLGVGEGSYSGTPVGADRDLTVMHEAAVNFTGTNEEGPKWGGTIVYGNMMPFGGFDNQSEVFPGSSFSESVLSDVYIQDAWVMFDTSIAGLGFNAQVGRIGVMVSPYIFMRPDNTPYFVNERWDNGRWAVDGAMLGFQFGAAKLNVFGGRTSYNRSTTNAVNFQPISAGHSGIPFTPGLDRPRGFASGGLFTIDRTLGATLNVPITQNGSLNLAYIWLQSDTVTVIGADSANGVNVFGGDIRFNFGGPTLEAGYSQSNVVYNNDNVVDEDNAAWYARLGWNQPRWGVNVGYRMIEPQFSAPGWWGRIGLWWNPVDIEGFMADAHFDLTDSARLTASAELYKGTETTIGGTMGLSDDDEIRRFLVGIAYKINNSWDFGLGYEHVEWDLADRPGPGFVGGKPVERWWNIGFGYTLSNNVGLKLLWQISDYDSKGVAGFNPFAFGPGAGDTRARGGVAVAQLSIKY